MDLVIFYISQTKRSVIEIILQKNMDLEKSILPGSSIIISKIWSYHIQYRYLYFESESGNCKFDIHHRLCIPLHHNFI